MADIDLSKVEAIRHDDIAQKLRTRHLGRIVFDWVEVCALQRNHPDVTSAKDWETLEALQIELTETLKEKPDG
jgi:hypothetical protein